MLRLEHGPTYPRIYLTEAVVLEMYFMASNCKGRGQYLCDFVGSTIHTRLLFANQISDHVSFRTKLLLAYMGDCGIRVGLGYNSGGVVPSTGTGH